MPGIIRDLNVKALDRRILEFVEGKAPNPAKKDEIEAAMMPDPCIERIDVLCTLGLLLPFVADPMTAAASGRPPMLTARSWQLSEGGRNLMDRLRASEKRGKVA